MSYKHYQWAWDSPVEKSTERLVLLALADYANDNGTCFPSADALAKKTAMNRKTVFVVLKSLEARCLISIRKRKNFGNEYFLNMEAVPQSGVPETVVPKLGVPKLVQVEYQKRDEGCTENGTQAVPKTVLEPTNNQPITNQLTNDAAKEKKTRGSRLVIDALPDEWRAFCEQEDPELDPQRVFDNFKDYWQSMSGSKSIKSNWLATWKNNVRSFRNAPAWKRNPVLKNVTIGGGAHRELTQEERHKQGYGYDW